LEFFPFYYQFFGERQMKKTFFALAVLATIFALISCGGSDSGHNNYPQQQQPGSNNPGGSCQTIDGNTWSSPATSKMNWIDAKNYCANLTECDSKWRLPDINELRTLIQNCYGAQVGGSCRLSSPGCLYMSCMDTNCYCECKGSGYYSKLGDSDLWSSSEITDYNGYAWYVPFDGGCDGNDTVFNENSSKHGVRCIRTGAANSGNGNGGSGSGGSGSGNGGSSTYSSCAEIYECQNKCSSSDQECNENCFYKGTSEAQSTASTMFGCWNSYCADAADDFANCADTYCYDETHNCPLYPVTDCPNIYSCLNDCDSGDEDCQGDCLNAASSEGYNRFVKLYNCTSEYCSEMSSNDAYQTCAYSYCSDEIWDCGYRD